MPRFVATPEKIEEINRLYAEIGVKAEVARRIGCSASTVARYIDPHYALPTSAPEIEIDETAKPTGSFELMRDLSAADDMVQAFCDACILTEEEWYQLQEIQSKYATA